MTQPTTTAIQPTYVTQKGLNEDQLQELLKRLLDHKIIPPNPAIDNIIKTYSEFEASPTKTLKNLKYDLVTGKVVQGQIHRLNFAMSHVGIMTERNELYFILDNSKIICVYKYSDEMSGEEVFFFLTTLLDEFNIIPLFNPEESELLEITGVTELQ